MCAVLPIQLSIFLHKLIRIFQDYLLVFDVEIDIESIQKLGLQIAKKILGHRNILIPAAVDLLRRTICAYLFIECLFTDLNPCRVEWCILILKRTHQHYVLEPLESWQCC